MNNDLKIGQYLTSLREQAGLKQIDLAKKIAWSPAVLSRVENGERSVTEDELEIVLGGIGVDDVTGIKQALTRSWEILPEPAFTDRDSNLLWEAEQTAKQIRALAERPNVNAFFQRRLARYEEELVNAGARVLNKRFKVAFVGTIGVGKSTAICRAEGLELPTGQGMPKAVLETGGGGVTLCEVHVRQGPGFGLIAEPCPHEELRRHVYEFANFLKNPPLSDDDENEPGSPGISREVERAVRNMAHLPRKRGERRSDGSVVPAIDEARVLAGTVSDAKALAVEILARMELHKRDARDVWHSDTSNQAPLAWLQETFERVNNGRHPEFTLPKRIELIIPTVVLGDESVSVTLIDTQGIDEIAERADVEQHFDDVHTIIVLCTVFNEAPSTSIQRLLKRAKEAGRRTLESNASILVLPRTGEALAMKDNGYPAQTSQEGYDLKGEQVELKMHPLGLKSLPLAFFNAAEDEPQVFRAFIHERIHAVRDFHRATLREIVSGANALLLNYEKEQAREVMQQAASHLANWLDHNLELPHTAKGHVEDSLISLVRQAHAMTIYAAIVRDGEWYRLDYAHQLRHGAQKISAQILEPKLKGFREIAENLLSNEQFAEAHDLIRQAMRSLEGAFDAIVRKAGLVGQSIHADEMKPDTEFWAKCGREWGRGKGYRDRINNHNADWFRIRHDGESDARVVALIAESWKKAINSVRELLAQE